MRVDKLLKNITKQWGVNQILPEWFKNVIKEAYAEGKKEGTKEG